MKMDLYLKLIVPSCYCLALGKSIVILPFSSGLLLKILSVIPFSLTFIADFFGITMNFIGFYLLRIDSTLLDLYLHQSSANLLQLRV
jgi:hypothetical protein